MKEVKNKLRKNENKTKRNIIEERKCKKVSGGSQRIKKREAKESRKQNRWSVFVWATAQFERKARSAHSYLPPT